MKIIISGSMASSKDMVAVEESLKALRHEVTLPKFTRNYATLDNVDGLLAESTKEKIEHDLIHDYFEEIKIHDVLLVVNIDRKGIKGYIGGNSFLEMGFAFILHKPLYLLNEIPNVSYRDEIEAMMPIVLNGDLSKIT